MSDNTRCDCLTDTHAIEFDFAAKWAEAIGQSLNYARLTGKRPGIVLICGKGRRDKEKFFRAQAIAREYKLPLTVWQIDCE